LSSSQPTAAAHDFSLDFFKGKVFNVSLLKSMKKTALIIGAGPAGLTAAYELLTRSENIHPIVFEKTDYIGGISRTCNYKGNRIDIGGHRFFSKSDRVMNWWFRFMPLQEGVPAGITVSYQNSDRALTHGAKEATANPEKVDLVMLIRRRISRIFYLRRFFDYPISLNQNTISNLGLVRMIRIGVSYIWSCLFPIKPEKNLEQFFINRFGRELYETFFKSYTEKVWGVSCQDISAEWGAQRIKGLSVTKTLLHATKKVFRRKTTNDIRQKGTETSLLEQFLYPKWGPGQMWEEVARQVKDKGGEIIQQCEVRRIFAKDKQITGIEVVNKLTGESRVYEGEYVMSSMPIKDLVVALDSQKPTNVLEVSNGLVYRDFITVGLLLKKFKPPGNQRNGEPGVPDCWIYVQEPDVLVGRIQIFNNWSPYMVKDPSNTWVGLEYFCQESDSLWRKSDAEMIELGKQELQKMGLIDKDDVLDATVIRMEKTYPAYFGTYNRFDEVRGYLDSFHNLFLMGRNGMHRYNNQDHSMLTAMTAVDLILSDDTDKSTLWSVNTEQEYHEQKSEKHGG
jgi:protoporphyrinogen oxidase